MIRGAAVSVTLLLPAVPIEGVTVSQSESSPVTESVQAAEAVKERVVERLSMASSVYSVCSMVRGCGVSDPSSLLLAARERRVERVSS